MKHKSIAVASITVLLCMVLGNIIACLPPPTIEYALVINSTEGGSVTTPGDGTFTYDEATVVNLVAEAEEGYLFVNWTGDVDTIDDIDAAETTITMLDHYSITANFGLNVVFSDDFSDENSGWLTFDIAYGRCAYVNGCLYVKDSTPDPMMSIFTAFPSYFTDFILEIETWLVDGTDDNWHIIGCRHQDTINSYFFIISADGYYAIWKAIDGEETVFVYLTYSHYINQGVGAVNLIHIECIGSSLSLSVNGHLLWEGTDTDATLSEGAIALGANALSDPFTEIAFDNIVVAE